MKRITNTILILALLFSSWLGTSVAQGQTPGTVLAWGAGTFEPVPDAAQSGVVSVAAGLAVLVALADLQGEAGVYREKRRGVEIPVWVFRPEDATPAPADCALLIHRQGRATLADKAGFIREWIASRHIVYVIEPFGIGNAIR